MPSNIYFDNNIFYKNKAIRKNINLKSNKTIRGIAGVIYYDFYDHKNFLDNKVIQKFNFILKNNLFK